MRKKTVKVKFTTSQMLDAQDQPGMETYQDFILALFREQGMAVVNWKEIKYFWGKNTCTVEGTTNEGLLSL